MTASNHSLFMAELHKVLFCMVTYVRHMDQLLYIHSSVRPKLQTLLLGYLYAHQKSVGMVEGSFNWEKCRIESNQILLTQVVSHQTHPPKNSCSSFALCSLHKGHILDGGSYEHESVKD
jgi:hypothetical protein